MTTNYLFLSIVVIFNLLILINFEKIKLFYINIDKPDFKRKLHKNPMPLAGGMIVFLNLLCCLIFINSNHFLLLNEIYFESQKDLILFLVSPSLKLIFI